MVENDQKTFRVGLRQFHVESGDSKVKEGIEAVTGEDVRQTLAAIGHQSGLVDFTQFQQVGGQAVLGRQP